MRQTLFSLRFFALIAISVVTFGAPATNAIQKNLEQCQKYYADFDYTGVLTECGVAAGNPRTTPTERLEVFSLLGFAHTALGSPEKAQIWFLRLLAIDPTHSLGSDVSPRFRSGFKTAKRKFRKKGVIRIRHKKVVVDDKTPFGESIPLRFSLADPLGRVESASISLVVASLDADTASPDTASPDTASVDSTAEVPKEILLTRVDDEGGRAIFEGTLPSLAEQASLAAAGDASGFRATYSLTLKSALDAVVVAKPKFSPVSFEVSDALVASKKPLATNITDGPNGENGTGDEKTIGDQDESEGLGVITIVGIGAGGAAVGLLMTAAVGGSIAFFCLQNERCTAPAPNHRPSSSVRVEVN